MAILVQDSFDRANSTTLGNADTGQAWQMLGALVMGVSSNQAYASAVSNNLGAYVETSNTDVKISVNVAVMAGEPGIIFRVVDGNNHVRAVRSGTNLILQKRVSGVNTTLGTKAVGAYTTNEKHSIITKSDGTLEYYLNDVLQLTATDTAHSTSTKHGFGYATCNASTKFDNLLIESLSGTPTTQDGTASILGTGTLTTTGNILKEGSASLLSTGLLTTNSLVLREGTVSLQGQGILTANADVIHTPTTIDGVFTSLGTGFLTANGEIIEFIEPEPPAVTVDTVLELLFDTENYVLLTSDIETELQLSSELENKVSLTFNL